MTCPSVPLSSAEIAVALQTLPGWTLNENALQRMHTGKTYLAALEALNAIARLSEAADHHPDLTLAWKTLTVRYWTHTACGVTTLDVDLARQVEALLALEALKGR